MNVTVKIVRNDLDRFSRGIGGAIRQGLLAAGREFYDTTRSNFGVSGIDRPKPWPPLSESYKRELREKSFGTPLVPTLLRNGTFRASIRIGNLTNNSISIWTECPFASAHQFGVPWRNLPARPFFPVFANGPNDQNARLTPRTEQKVLAAFTRAIERAAGQ